MPAEMGKKGQAYLKITNEKGNLFLIQLLDLRVLKWISADRTIKCW